MLYADITILLTESDNDLQLMLDGFESYCDQWKLNINVNNTIILPFSRGRIRNYKSYLKGVEVEIVKNYKYLEVFFARNGNIYTSRQYLKE